MNLIRSVQHFYPVDLSTIRLSSCKEHWPGEALPLAVLNEHLQQTFREMGFDGYLYYGLADVLPDHDPVKAERLSLNNIREHPRFIGTLKADFMRDFFRQTGGDSRMWPQIRAGDQIFQRLPLDRTIQIQRRVHDFLTDHHIHSQLFIPMRPMTGDAWHCQFLLNSRMPPAELSRWLLDKQHELLTTCSYFHALLMRDYHQYFNPWLAGDVICDRALDVLTLTADGFSSRDVAKKVNLSEKGVNYHLTQLRELLGANNRVHLVSVAKDMMLI